MPRTKSILRYPGGKTQLSDFVKHTIEINSIRNPIYCEPFCGGAGVAFDLLLSGAVDSIVLNDLDSAIYSIWHAVLNDTDRFVNIIENTPISISEWNNQKSIFNRLKNTNGYSFELAYAAFFLNRTNRSGIITGGPIGGLSQNSSYKLDCRFNKLALIEKIKQIASHADKIHLYSTDGINFINTILPKYNPQHLFIYFDPPYYQQGPYLYKNGLTDKYHESLAKTIQNLYTYKWITTYDRASRIQSLYTSSVGFLYDIQYVASQKRKEQEFLFTNTITHIESYGKVSLSKLT